MAALVSRRTPASTSASVELFASIVSSPSRIETRAGCGGNCAGVGGGGGGAGTCACGGGSGAFFPFFAFLAEAAVRACAVFEPACADPAEALCAVFEPCCPDLVAGCIADWLFVPALAAAPAFGGAADGVCATRGAPNASKANNGRDLRESIYPIGCSFTATEASRGPPARLVPVARDLTSIPVELAS
jgi:hypothetical protein